MNFVNVKDYTVLLFLDPEFPYWEFRTGKRFRVLYLRQCQCNAAMRQAYLEKKTPSGQQSLAPCHLYALEVTQTF